MMFSESDTSDVAPEVSKIETKEVGEQKVEAQEIAEVAERVETATYKSDVLLEREGNIEEAEDTQKAFVKVVEAPILLQVSGESGELEIDQVGESDDRPLLQGDDEGVKRSELPSDKRSDLANYMKAQGKLLEDESPTGRDDGGDVAIDTVPLPEKPMTLEQALAANVDPSAAAADRLPQAASELLGDTHLPINEQATLDKVAASEVPDSQDAIARETGTGQLGDLAINGGFDDGRTIVNLDEPGQTTNLTELFKGGYKNVDDLDYPDYGPPLSEPDSDKVSDGDDNELTQEERSQILDMLQRFEALQQKLQAEKLDEMRAARGEEEDEGKSELTPEEQWDQMYLEIMAWLERNGTNAEVEELLADILAQRAMARGDDSD